MRQQLGSPDQALAEEGKQTLRRCFTRKTDCTRYAGAGGIRGETLDRLGSLGKNHCSGGTLLGAPNEVKFNHHRRRGFVVISIVRKIHQVRCRREQKGYHNYCAANVFRYDHSVTWGTYQLVKE